MAIGPRVWRCEWRGDDLLGTADLPLLRRGRLAVLAYRFIASIAFFRPPSARRRGGLTFRLRFADLLELTSRLVVARGRIDPWGPLADLQLASRSRRPSSVRWSPRISTSFRCPRRASNRPGSASVSAQALPSSRVDASSSSSAKTASE
jgi:hypothetical protein